MDKNKIALQLYSVRDDMKEDFYGTLKKVKEFGYGGVEFAGLHGNDPLEVKKMCEEIGLVPISAHVSIKAFLKDMDAAIDCYEKVGVKYVVIPHLAEEYRMGQPGYRTVVEVIKVLGQKLREKGMVLGYHNHDFEFTKFDGEYALDLLYQEVGPELLQTELDTCWVNVGGENPAEYIKKYAGRTPIVHLKDFVGTKSNNMYELIGIDEGEKKETDGPFEYRPVGKGKQDFPAIVAAADAGGAEWYVVEQDRPSMGLEPLECAKVSIDYLLNEIAK